MARTSVEKIRELDEQKAKLIAAAKSDAIRKIDRVLKELNSLGFNYRLVADGDRQPFAEKPRKGRGKGTVVNGLCKICSFPTVPPHDARSHRGQSKKAPFTSQELTERELRRG